MCAADCTPSVPVSMLRLVLSFGAAVISSLESRACSAEAPLANFVRHPQYDEVKISPDGDYLAAKAVVNGQSVLGLIRLRDMSGINITPRTNNVIADFSWVGPQRVMYSTGEKVGGLERPAPTDELFVTDADGRNDRIIFGVRMGNDFANARREVAVGNLLAPLREDPQHVLIQSRPFNGHNFTDVFPVVYKIDLRSGATMQVATSPLRDASFLVDRSGNVRFAYGVDIDQAQKVYYRAAPGSDWMLLFDQSRGDALSGGYGESFVAAGYREWGGKMQDDVTDATRWAINQVVADAQRICIFGASYGGYAALEGAVTEPDLYKCAIGYVGVYDLRLMYTRGDIPQSQFGENYLKKALGENQAELWNRSPLAHLDALTAKVMLIVGGADKRVPSIHGENLHAALERRGVAHEWIYERGEGHGFYNEEHVADMYAKVLAFLDRNIGANLVAP